MLKVKTTILAPRWKHVPKFNDCTSHFLCSYITDYCVLLHNSSVFGCRSCLLDRRLNATVFLWSLHQRRHLLPTWKNWWTVAESGALGKRKRWWTLTWLGSLNVPCLYLHKHGDTCVQLWWLFRDKASPPPPNKHPEVGGWRYIYRFLLVFTSQPHLDRKVKQGRRMRSVIPWDVEISANHHHHQEIKEVRGHGQTNQH